ncbi:hypothetical protein C0992_007242 [Termitomyces sp. T32_za158]|nr:hypothetical protein C0992_007242 [Termitomyces sp. T32_za158]
MAMQSKVGNPQVYEAGDQRPPRVGPRDAGEDPIRQESYKIGSDKYHLDLDSKDQRSIANRLAAAKKASEEKSHETVSDPLAPARTHGNEPSRGAKIDAEIQAEEEELLRRKDKA